ncbi:MAG: 4-hydroxy-tetrahydrodipicolinate synthase [Pseudomonadota bacterium]|jgi:4-hydroxy-tetrahydrodipicolinate synthase
MFFDKVNTALVTPFVNGKIDFFSLEKLINFQLENGVKSFVVAGSTGEGNLLAEGEFFDLLVFAREITKNKAKIIATCSSPSTQNVLSVVKTIHTLNCADALLCTVPFYVKPQQEGIFEHFKAINNISNLPICLYNIPSRTGVDAQPETVVKIAKECKNVVAIKNSAAITKILELKSILNINNLDNFQILCSEDAEQIPFNAAGGCGVVSVLSNIKPAFCLKVQNEMKTEYNNILFQLSKAMFCNTNPVPVKYALYKMGIINSPEVRLPLLELNDIQKKIVDETLSEYIKI